MFRLFLLNTLAACTLIFAGCNTNSTLVPPASTTPKWNQTIAPNNAAVQTFAAAGAYILAGTADGILRSSDHGATWNYVFQGTNVVAIASTADTFGNVTLFAGTSPGGILESNNLGGRWYSANYGLTDHHILALASNGSLLVLSTSGEGAFISTDNGGTWLPRETGLPNSKIDAIAFRYNLESVHQSSGLNIFLGTLGSGVYYSNDTGEVWTPANTGLADTVTALAVATPDNLYAGTRGQGMFHSTDNGFTWTVSKSDLISQYPLISALQGEGVNVIAAANNGSDAGVVLYSTDAGVNWTSLKTGLPRSGAHSVGFNGTGFLAGVFKTIWRYPQ